MAITNFQSEVWSSLVELQAQEVSIARRVTGAQYQPDADGAKAIKTNRVITGTIGDYTPGSDITIAELDDEQKTIDLDQKKYFAFYVDDVNAAQSQADYRDPAVVQHASALALKADEYTFALPGADVNIPAGNKIGASGTPISITDANVDEYIYQMKETLDEQNAMDERWLIVPSWFNSKLALNGLGIQLGDNKKNELFEQGEVIRYAGFNIIQSNSLNQPAADEWEILAYTARAIPMVDQVQKVTAGDAEKRFAEYIKGLYVFGAEVVFPNEVVVLTAAKG